MKRGNELKVRYEKNTPPLNRILEDQYKEDFSLEETL